MFDSVVLVSLGRHPVSLRPRLADCEARALGLVCRAGGRPTALHAGPAATGEAVLRGALGLGAARAVLIELPPEADPLPALLAWLAAHPCDVILAGERAETGEGSGMVPFLAAERLGCALVAGAVGLEHVEAQWSVLQALPGGRRRMLQAASSLVLAVGPSAPPAPLCALGPARRAAVSVLASPVQAPADDFHTWPSRPARHRPRRLAPLGGDDAAREARHELAGVDPVAAADAILDFLERESLLNPAAASHERA